MKTRINLTDRKTFFRIDLADFNKKTAEIFNNVVLPQIEKAKSIQKPLNTIKCNNPV
jgi:hypothetical protein